MVAPDARPRRRPAGVFLWVPVPLWANGGSAVGEGRVGCVECALGHCYGRRPAASAAAAAGATDAAAAPAPARGRGAVIESTASAVVSGPGSLREG